MRINKRPIALIRRSCSDYVGDCESNWIAFLEATTLRTELHAALNSCLIASAIAKTFIPSFASYVPDLPLSFGKSDLPA